MSAAHCSRHTARLRCFWLGWCCALAAPLRMSTARTQRLVLVCCFIGPPSAHVDSASGLTGNGLRREGAFIGRAAYGTAEQKSTCYRSTWQAYGTAPASSLPGTRDSLRKGRGLVDAPGEWVVGRSRNTRPIGTLPSLRIRLQKHLRCNRFATQSSGTLGVPGARRPRRANALWVFSFGWIKSEIGAAAGPVRSRAGYCASGGTAARSSPLRGGAPSRCARYSVPPRWSHRGEDRGRT
jgi:hypothetical protein